MAVGLTMHFPAFAKAFNQHTTLSNAEGALNDSKHRQGERSHRFSYVSQSRRRNVIGNIVEATDIDR